MRKVFVGGVETAMKDLKCGQTFEAFPSQDEKDLEEWKSSRRFRAISDPFDHEGMIAIRCEELR